MWILHFLPDSFIQFIVDCILIAGAGLVVFGISLARWIPYIRNIRKLLTFVGVILLTSGAYFKGGYGVEMEWRAKVDALQAKIAEAEAKSKETNVVIQEKVVTKIKHVKDTQIKIQKQIVEKEHVINAECTIPAEAIELLNKAAEKPVQGESK